ncbi:TldD/PmbA family protein [Desulfurococcaceae archaeon MEX13E-LK6-19]|nr:TldD/PmbA family protein [Desulfurococcaceae archaeon MEX13E-LK6-19]
MDNGVLREYSVTRKKGVGIRVIVDGFEGFSATNNLDKESIRIAIEKAIKTARAMSYGGKKVKLAEKPVSKDKISSKYSIDPLTIDPEEKVGIVKEMNKASREIEGVVSSTTRLGIQYDHRIFASTEGDYVDVEVRLVGVGQYSIASRAGVMERVYDSRSMVAGWEYIKSLDLTGFAREVSDLAVKATQAKAIKPGTYTAILDNEMVGLLLHEAFGHATEGDIVAGKGSILYGKVGEKVASKHVTIVDDGLIEGGYFVPYDDEGVKKRKVKTVENGVLKRFLQSRTTATLLGMELTGNARAQDYEHQVLVRQTNTYMEPGDYSVEELFEGVKKGVYVRGRGALGGQVDTSMGTFTFTAGPSYLIEKGEIKELVRGVMLSGMILETLKNVDAVAKDLKVKTSVFGGCGKDGQLARVGDGGPHIRVKKITIGG